MTQNCSDQDVFFQAILNQDFATIKRCQDEGQDVNQVWEDGVFEQTIFQEMCTQHLTGFIVCVALGNIDVEATDKDGSNCLAHCADAYRMGVCLEMGADIHKIFEDVYENFKGNPFAWKISASAWDLGLILLGAGSNPENTKLPPEMKPQIEYWIAQIDTAKPCLEAIFDDEMLEQLLMGFVFNEAFLKKALQNCD